MNQRSDIDRLLRHWMDEGPSRMPDRIVDVVADRISVQRQRRSWRLLRRLPMNPILKLGAAAAAVLVIAVLGYNLLPGPTGTGGQATPTPTASPSPASSSSAVFPPWWDSDSDPTGAGIMPPGNQATRQFSPAVSFTVPDGWVNSSDDATYLELFPDTSANEAEFARSGGLANNIQMVPETSPWFICESAENNRGATAAEMVAAVTTNEALATTGLVDVAIGGLTGKQFDVRLNPEWTGSCLPRADDPPDRGDYRVRGILLDIPGGGVLVIFVNSLHSADFEAFLAEAMPIVESFRFDSGQ